MLHKNKTHAAQQYSPFLQHI